MTQDHIKNEAVWAKIMELMALMVLADDKVYPEEVDTFKRAAVQLKDVLCPGLMLTEDMAVDWFKNHKEDLQARKAELDFYKELKALVFDLRRIPEKATYLDLLTDIAAADGEIHTDENRLIERVSRMWGTPKDYLG